MTAPAHSTLVAPATPPLERFRSQVARHLGLRFDDANLAGLDRLLQRRAAARHQDGADYLARLEQAPTGQDPHQELAALAPELTVPETYFFRYREQFLALQEHAVPQCLAAWPGRRSLRILSAGCASGEEPYSIAIALWARRSDLGFAPAIRAVDLNPQIIQKARTARYTAWSLRDVPPTLQQRWFRPHGRELVLDDAVRAAVDFEVRNLCVDDHAFWQPGCYDVVFCRNVLMYFTPAAARAVVARITQSLVPGGYLFLGHAETLRDLSQDYDLCHSHGSFYYRRRPVPQPAPAGADAGPGAIGPATPNAAMPVDDALGPALALLQREQFAQALALLQALPAALAARPEARLLHGVLLIHAGRFDAAGEVLLTLAPANAAAHYALALCREGQGDLAGAAGHDHAAMALDPAFAMPRLHLGLLARRRGDPAAMRRELAHAMALLAHEDAARLLLFGGGFQREDLLALCRAGLQAGSGEPQ